LHIDVIFVSSLFKFTVFQHNFYFKRPLSVFTLINTLIEMIHGNQLVFSSQYIVSFFMKREREKNVKSFKLYIWKKRKESERENNGDIL